MMFDWLRKLRPSREQDTPVVGNNLVIPFGVGALSVGITLVQMPDGRYLPAVALSPAGAVTVDETGEIVQGQDVPDGSVFLSFASTSDAHRLVGAILACTEQVELPDIAEPAND